MEGSMSSLIFSYHIPAYGNKYTEKLHKTVRWQFIHEEMVYNNRNKHLDA